jgi:hypothetical protein
LAFDPPIESIIYIGLYDDEELSSIADEGQSRGADFDTFAVPS